MIRLVDHLPPGETLLAALNPVSRAMQGSMILGIAAEVRARVAAGASVCNLTVGDFDPVQFPLPPVLVDAVAEAYRGGLSNYPPPEGIHELRQEICEWYARDLGLGVTPDQVVVASGARPVMYAFYRLFLEPGDVHLFPVPSWNSGYYSQLCQAVPEPLPTRAEDGFFPTPERLAPALRRARVFVLNSPANPTGEVIAPDTLAGIARVVVEENRLRAGEGRKPVMWMWDQVYWRLTFGGARHAHPVVLVPEVAPYVVTVDAVSKSFAATGLRVGWAVLPGPLADRMKALVGHMGAWAPKPEQWATAALLAHPDLRAWEARFHAGILARLERLDAGLTALGIEHLRPQGAMYLSVRFDLFGRPGVDGRPMRTNDDVRRYLLAEAGVAVVPFQAFDLEGDSGWFRMSVGAVSLPALDAALERLGRVTSPPR